MRIYLQLIVTTVFFFISNELVLPQSTSKFRSSFLNSKNVYKSKTTLRTNDKNTSSTTIKNGFTLSPTSTVVFEESFEGMTGFPPSGWKTVNADGGGTTGPWFQGNTSVFTAFSGAGYAAANYQGANDFYIDEWLISPRILSINANDTLLFWHRSPDYSSWGDSIEIRLSINDTALSSFVTKVDYFKTSTNGWVQNRYPLNNFVPPGSNIYIAFRYLLYDAGISGFSSDYAGIDLVQIVRPQVMADIKVVSIDYPLNKQKIVTGNTIEPLVTFQNVGTSTQTNIPVRLYIYPPSGTLYQNDQTITSLTSNQSVQISFGNYTPLVNGVYTIRAFSLLSGDQNPSNDSLHSSFIGATFVSGTFTVGSGGDIPTLKAAVDTLNNNIITNNVILSLINSYYNEPPLVIGPLDYSSIINSINIKPASGVSPTIEVNSTENESYGLAILGASKVTLDGSNSIQNERNLTIRTIGTYGKVGILVQGIEGSYADSNNIKNVNIRTSADSLSTSNSYYGILINGYSSDYKDGGNRISNCDITKHGAVGIAAQWQNGVIIENNFIHDWFQLGGENDVQGIWLADGTNNAIVRGNVIGNIENRVNYYWAVGIENSSGSTSQALVYNNMIYNILSSGAGSNVNRSVGIYSSNPINTGDGYYFNSVYLSGTDLSTSSVSHTAGFEIAGGTNITVKNNIVFNESILSGTSLDNKAYGIYLSLTPNNYSSDHNDYFVPSTQGVVGFNLTNKTTLLEWQNSFSPKQDSLSISADPLFISSSTGNLHIQSSEMSPVNASGTPISGITTDIDNNFRNPLSPDIGADEYTPGASLLSIEYNKGWNIVSVPLTVSDSNITTIFPSSISNAFAYINGYVQQTMLSNGVGYWLKFPSTHNLEIAGSPRLVDTINVKTGWNLIGTISNSVTVSFIVQVPSEIVTSKFYSYQSGYVQVDTLLPGKGYWVKVNQDGKLVLISQ